MIRKLLVCLSVLCLCAGSAHAQFLQQQGQQPAQQMPMAPPSEDHIANVKVEGVQRIEPATVISYLTLKAGDPFDPARVNESLKALYATGYFSDISLFREGNDLIVHVVENPIINQIAFEGNEQVKDDDLTNETQLRPRYVYTRAKVQEDVQRLLQIYRRLGNYAATIDPKIIKLDQNRVNLVYEINEGNKTKVRAIKFIGNTQFTSDTLQSTIQTKEARWYRFLSSDDNYDQDRMAYDEELLRKFYLSKGYADFSVKSSIAELTPDQKDFFITFTITEGKRYKFGKINMNNNLKGVNAAALQKAITTKEGNWYNADQVDNTVLAITDALANQQFAFVDVKPEVQLNREKHIVDLTYNIAESPRVFVERIDISGNTRTQDQVIRREMMLVEGDPFNKLKLKKSEQRIRDLGFFKEVNIKTIPGSRPDLAVITINVQEQSTGELSVGAGYSTTDGPLADFNIREKNLLGKGQDLSLGLTTSHRTQNESIRYTEPYFLDRNLSAGFDIFHTKTDYQDVSSYDFSKTGLTLRTGYPLSEKWRQDLHYTVDNSDIENILATASIYIQDQAGPWSTSEVGHTVTYNNLDSKLDPAQGFIGSVSNDVAGLGGDARYVATKLHAAQYWPLTEDKGWVFSTDAESGYIVGLGQDVRINDRYFLGGTTFRGFNTAGIGARDISTKDALGGDRYAKGSLELTAPLGSSGKDLGLRSHLFTDFGTLGHIDETGPNIADKESLRASVGIGISWKSPLGPLRGDLAIPVVKEPYDENRIFNFNFGTRF
jgi:outer membrane protein insertion porin family